MTVEGSCGCVTRSPSKFAPIVPAQNLADFLGLGTKSTAAIRFLSHPEHHAYTVGTPAGGKGLSCDTLDDAGVCDAHDVREDSVFSDTAARTHVTAHTPSRVLAGSL